MKDDSETLFYLGAGPLAAILLGMALVPLRGLTTASNLSFAFMALTIVVAELGGRGAAVATAVVSALTLDFFLTQPYMRLTIEDKHDVIAFLGLGVCGLIAAALGSHRGERIATLRAVEKQRDLLRSALRDWDGVAAGVRLAAILRRAREVFPLAGAVIRDDRGLVVASADPADALRPLPQQVLQPDTLLAAAASDHTALGWSLPLPEAGGRVALLAGERTVGWLDVWSDGTPASVDARRGLTDLARLLTVLIAG
jgi:hypothetical protein